jgi:hypothetical protein
LASSTLRGRQRPVDFKNIDTDGDGADDNV